MTRSPEPFDDEGTYVAQAWAVEHLHALAPYTYWYDHPPLGWLLIAAVAWPLHLLGAASHAVSAGRVVVFAAQLISTVLLYILARRMRLNHGFAASAVLLFTVSPLAVHYQRMVLLDNLATPFLLIAFVCALTPRRRLWAYAGSGACLALAALIKETSLLFVPAVTYAVWANSDPRNRRFATTLYGSWFVMLASFYPLYALLKGELLQGAHHTSLEYGVRFQLLDRTSTGSVFDAHSGVRTLVQGWLMLDHALPIAALGLLPCALAIRRLRPAGIALAVPVAMVFRPNGYIPAMFIIGMLPFGAVVVAGVLDNVWKVSTRPDRIGTRARGLVFLGPMAALAAAVAFVAYSGPTWARADSAEMTQNRASPYWRAEAWLTRHVSRRATILTDDVIWTDLVDRGFGRHRVVWFYKLDLDPAVRYRFRAGYRDFRYIVVSNLMRGIALQGIVPQTAAAIRHSRTVQTFAAYGERIEIRRITPPTRPNQEIAVTK